MKKNETMLIPSYLTILRNERVVDRIPINKLSEAIAFVDEHEFTSMDEFVFSTINDDRIENTVKIQKRQKLFI